MAKKNDSLGDRMKGYEGVSRNFLTRRVPAIIRLDGKAFHTFTKGMEKPFDPVLTQAMQETMKYLCENIQGCVLGYTQSDEITLVLTDYATIQTDAWFGYNIQKMCSVSASMATMAFNREFERIAEDWFHDNGPYWGSIGVDVDVDLTLYERYNAYQKKMCTAMFDSRVFSVPKEEVCNCLIWRQQDATRNSIEAVGQANFSHHELHKKTCNMIQEMLWSQRGINWNDFPTELKRGSCCIKRQFEETIDDPRNPGQKITVCRNRWIIDHEIPVFTQDREYNDTKPILSDPPYLLQFILAVVLSVLCGATIMFMWNWFVVPLGLPMIGLVQALGLDTLITFIVTTRVNTNPGPFWDRWIIAITYALLTLFSGWLLHFFM